MEFSPSPNLENEKGISHEIKFEYELYRFLIMVILLLLEKIKYIRARLQFLVIRL